MPLVRSPARVAQELAQASAPTIIFSPGWICTQSNSPTGRSDSAPTPVTKQPRRSTQVPTGVVDARQLSRADYEARLAQLGLTAPSTEWSGQFGVGVSSNEANAQREAGRAVERAGKVVERERVRVARDRAAELESGSIDARTASVGEVRARLAQLGIEGSPNALSVIEIKQPLKPRGDGSDYSAQRAKANETVRAALDLCQRTGQRLDTRKLDAFELAAYKALRGYDPS